MTSVLRSYREVPEATALIRTYTRDTRYFRLGLYAKLFNTARPKDGFTSLPESQRSTRHCFPFGTNADEPMVVAEHAGIPAARAMTVRTVLVHKLLDESLPFNPAFAAQNNGHSQIKRTAGLLADRLTQLELPLEGMRLVCNPNRAIALLDRKYDKKAAETVCGVQLVVENATKIVGSVQKYVFPDDVAHLVYLDSRDTEPSRNCSTLQFRLYDEMCVETKHDENGRGGRIVEDYAITIDCPKLLYCLTWDV